MQPFLLFFVIHSKNLIRNCPIMMFLCQDFEKKAKYIDNTTKKGYNSICGSMGS